MAAITFREALSSDLESVRQCAHEAYGKYIARIGKVPAPMIADFGSSIAKGDMVVACDDDSLIGYVVFYPTGVVMHLENVAVSPAHSGRGVGRSLITLVEDAAVNQSLSSVDLYTNELMTENLQMYPHLGYTEYDRRCEDGFSRVYFRKQL